MLAAQLAWGRAPSAGLPRCGLWHLQVTCKGKVGICHALSSSSSFPAQTAASATGSLKPCHGTLGVFCHGILFPSTKLTLLAGSQTPGNTCGPPKLTGLGNMVLSTEAPQGASDSVHKWLSLGLLWGELQVLGHEDRSRKPQCLMPFASRGANLWCGEGFSKKKKKWLIRERLTGTPLPFKGLSTGLQPIVDLLLCWQQQWASSWQMFVPWGGFQLPSSSPPPEQPGLL